MTSTTAPPPPPGDAHEAVAPGADPAHTVPAAGPRRSKRPLGFLIAAASVVAILGAGFLAIPMPRALGTETGDAALAAAARPYLDGHENVGVVLIDGADERFAGFGAEDDRVFEIGSSTKTFTATLLQDAVARGEVTLDTTVQDVLGERAAGSAIADVTLRELAAHTSGLPRLDAESMASATLPQLLRQDPYGIDAPTLVDRALASPLETRGTRAYSNLGTALLGQLLAERAGVAYPALVSERILDPVGMPATTVPTTAADLPPDAPTGATAAGQPNGAWTMGGYAPAGSIRSTPADMGAYIRAAMDGTLPGSVPFEAVAPLEQGEGEGGVGWVRTPLDDGRNVVWHNGMTGGFASFIGYIEGEERAVVVMTDTAIPVDELGLALLDGSAAA